ncbi:MAG: FG-GAP-like repeat-containing protein [Chryseolinea sp.]
MSRHSFILKFIGATAIGAIMSIGAAHAQKPEIKSIDKVMGSMGEVVTIKGSFFGTDATKLAVTFGASRAVIQSVTDQQLVVKVPFGTTYQTISVTNLTSGLTGITDQQFLLNFRSTHSFTLANLQGQYDFPAGVPTAEGLYDLCMCDFDGDKKVDVVSANDNTGFLTLLANGSTPGTIAFPVKFATNIASRSLHIKCGDLNGDGKPDIVATESGTTNKVFVLKNNSSGPSSFAFSAPLVVTLAGKRPKRIEIADLDLNGKPELIITSQATNTITILVNQSTLASISFSPVAPIQIAVPAAASTEGLAVVDMNQDGLPEIITSQFQTNSDIYIIGNKSTPGAIIAGDIKTLTVGSPIKNIRVGDLDGDGKPDIAYTKLTASEVGLFRNHSTATGLNFTAVPGIQTDATPWGIDFGDLDGDGKAEIAVASITKKSITILNNTSTPGSMSFVKYVQPTTYINRHVNICDVDGDGKPDIAFTSIDDNNLNIIASKISVFRNKTCMVPIIDPPGPFNVCAGFPLTLIATNGGGTTYEWTNATLSAQYAGTNEYTPTVSGEYFVIATSEGGNCKEQSNNVKVSISPGTAADPLPINNGPVCLGKTLNLQISNDLGPGFTYEWTGPNNYTSTGLNPAPVTNFELKHAGTYYVDVKASSGCVARRESTQVEAVDLPDFKVAFTGSALICQPDFKNLSVYPTVTGFTYQWFEKTAGILAGATSSTLLRNSSGEYYFQASSSNPGCPVISSTHAVLTVVTPPTAAFTLPATACKGQEIAFTNQSTGDSQSTLSHAWKFGDTGVSDAANPKHIYLNSGPFSVSLTVSYPSNTCPVTVTKSITITEAPAVTITNAENKFEICPGGRLILGTSNSFSSYAWSNGETSPTITVNASGEYSVSVVAANGCNLKAIQEITSLPEPVVAATATPEIIDEGESTQLSATGLMDFTWAPIETLGEVNQAETSATPISSTTYTVSGKDGNGCVGTASIEVKVRGEAIVNKLIPSIFFSPNGDATGQFWTIGGIDEYPQCGVSIYDDKGVRVFEAKPYLNNWEGTFNLGKRLPDGAYYFIIRCDGEENKPRSGSITILR